MLACNRLNWLLSVCLWTQVKPPHIVSVVDPQKTERKERFHSSLTCRKHLYTTIFSMLKTGKFCPTYIKLRYILYLWVLY